MVASPTVSDPGLRHGMPTSRSVKARAEADPYPAKCLPEHSHRTGPARHQVAGTADAGNPNDGTARVILGGIEIIHMMRKQQARYACSRQPPRAEQVHHMLAA